jgi:hypothetical protein
MYQHAERVVQAVANAQAGGIRSAALWAAHAQLQADHEALWQAWSEAADRSASQQRARASAGSAMGVSLTQMVLLWAMVVPSRLVPSRATGGRWVPQSAPPARGLLEGLDRACQRWTRVWCLDEIFVPREPILLGVAPRSLAWLAGQRGPERRGKRGGEVSEAWPHLEQGIADGGQGRERGVQRAHEARSQAQEPETPGPAPRTLGRDVLHTERELARG